jgi:hypothetical protein
LAEAEQIARDKENHGFSLVPSDEIQYPTLCNVQQKMQIAPRRTSS